MIQELETGKKEDTPCKQTRLHTTQAAACRAHPLRSGVLTRLD
jgi:hypothetical protein